MAKPPPLTMQAIFNRLSVITRTVHCAHLASGNIEAEEDGSAVEAVLDHALDDLQELLEEMRRQLPPKDDTEDEANG